MPHLLQYFLLRRSPVAIICLSADNYIHGRIHYYQEFEKHSYYHVQLAESGDLITHDKDKAVLTRMNWKREIETDLLMVMPSDTLGELVKVIARSKRNIFPVVDEYNILEGVVYLDDVREIMFQQNLYGTTFMKDLMTMPPSYIGQEREY